MRSNRNLRERNNAVSHLMVISFVAACGAVFTAFGFYGFNHFDFTRFGATLITLLFQRLQ